MVRVAPFLTHGVVYFGVTNFGNAFLVHRLADSDEIWHDYRYWCVACLLPFW